MTNSQKHKLRQGDKVYHIDNSHETPLLELEVIPSPNKFPYHLVLIHKPTKILYPIWTTRPLYTDKEKAKEILLRRLNKKREFLNKQIENTEKS